MLEYAAAVCSGGYIQLADLPDALLAAAARAVQEEAPAPLVLPPEAQLLQQHLRAAHWNVTAVAKQLGVARMTLYRRMKRWADHRAESPRRVTARRGFARSTKRDI